MNLDFNRFGTVRFKQGQNLEKQLCKSCAEKVCNYVDDEAMKASANMQEAEE